MVAEALGTALLLVAVVGSGIAAQRLSPGDSGLELFENAVATGCALAVIILALGPVSGAHLNPVVSLVDAALGGLSRREVVAYVTSNCRRRDRCCGRQRHVRSRAGHDLREGQVRGWPLDRRSGRPSVCCWSYSEWREAGEPLWFPLRWGAYITAAYFFTSSTSFANPAVTLARTLSTPPGIDPGSVAPFIAAELVGGVVAWVAIWFLHPDARQIAEVVVVPKLPVAEKRAL